MVLVEATLDWNHIVFFIEEVVPEDLLQGSDHFDNVDYHSVRRERQEVIMNLCTLNQRLPHEVLYDSVQRQGLVRPTPKTW